MCLRYQPRTMDQRGIAWVRRLRHPHARRAAVNPFNTARRVPPRHNTAAFAAGGFEAPLRSPVHPRATAYVRPSRLAHARHADAINSTAACRV